jgi:DNA-3-methyladenine glycosylase II
MLIDTFEPAAPYAFPLTLQVMGYSSVLDITHDSAYWRALNLPGGPRLAKVVSMGTTDAPQLEVYFLADSASPADMQGARVKLRRMLSIDKDNTPFYRFAQSDRALWPLIDSLRGLRNILAESLFEALALTIIEQQITLAAAQKGERWLVERCGQYVVHEGRRYYTFPQPAAIAEMTPDELKPLKITNRRSALLIEVARQQSIGEIDLEALRDIPPQQAYDELMRIKGVGHWTATWTLIRATGHHGYVFHNDVALQAAVNFYYFGLKGRASPQVVDEVFARYGDYAGLAAYYVITRWALERYPNWNQ